MSSMYKYAKYYSIKFLGVNIEIEDIWSGDAFCLYLYILPNFDFVLYQPSLVITPPLPYPTHIEQWEAKSWWKENDDEILSCSYHPPKNNTSTLSVASLTSGSSFSSYSSTLMDCQPSDLTYQLRSLARRAFALLGCSSVFSISLCPLIVIRVHGITLRRDLSRKSSLYSNTSTSTT